MRSLCLWRSVGDDWQGLWQICGFNDQKKVCKIVVDHWQLCEGGGKHSNKGKGQSLKGMKSGSSSGSGGGDYSGKCSVVNLLSCCVCGN